MDIEEAIRELKIQFVGEYDRQREAKDIAIEALEQQLHIQRTSNANKKRVENALEDAISRQAAIDLIGSMAADATSHGITPRLLPDYVIGGIESLPSVVCSRHKCREDWRKRG